MAATARATTDRLLDAAVDLFAERGFHGTSVRDIAERAGANVAAGHYHYGSKEGLYLAVLRAQFAAIRAELARRGANRTPSALRKLPRRELAKLLEARIATMLEMLIGPPPTAHGQLMLREMCDPTDAMPIIVGEFIEPLTNEMEQLVVCLMPDAGKALVRQIVFSIIGQVLFYRFTMPVALLLRREAKYPPGFARKAARHICTFSLHGIDGMAAALRRRTRAR